MGNICAGTRNKECLYSAKSPHEIKIAFEECIIYRRKDDCVKNLKRKKKKLLRKVHLIEEQLNDY
jgi:hypothetical protein